MNLPSRRDLAAPAAELAVAVEGTGQAQGDPDVAVLVEAGAERIFVIVAVDLPAVADDFEDVGLARALGVLDPAHVAALGHVEPAVLVGQAQHLVQAVGEAGELRLLRIGVESILRPPRSRRGGCRPPVCRRGRTRSPRIREPRPAAVRSAGWGSNRLRSEACPAQPVLPAALAACWASGLWPGSNAKEAKASNIAARMKNLLMEGPQGVRGEPSLLFYTIRSWIARAERL